jgi:hypothetical protein
MYDTDTLGKVREPPSQLRCCTHPERPHYTSERDRSPRSPSPTALESPTPSLATTPPFDYTRCTTHPHAGVVRGDGGGVSAQVRRVAEPHGSLAQGDGAGRGRPAGARRVRHAMRHGPAQGLGATPAQLLPVQGERRTEASVCTCAPPPLEPCFGGFLATRSCPLSMRGVAGWMSGALSRPRLTGEPAQRQARPE